MAHQFKNILFDLDGTLTDSKDGIIRTYQNTFKCMNLEPPSAKSIESIIGTGQREAYEKFLNTSEKSVIAQAMKFHHERYNSIGMFENRVYDGIDQLLQKLNEQKFSLFVVTAKFKNTAKQILEHFNLLKYFTAIYGPDPDGPRLKKAELIRCVLEEHSLQKSETVMIGDHANDIIAAKANNIASIAITYGYGCINEIKTATPNHIRKNLDGLSSLLLNI